MNDTLRRYAVVLAFAFALAPVTWQSLNAQQPLNPALKNWAAPLYWAPTPAEAEQQRMEQRIAHPDASSSAIAQAASIFTPPGPLTFIAITPCRVMDTRAGQGFTGAFGPPSLPAFGTARQVPMPSSSTCTIPSNAGAYSLNITAVSPGVLSFLSVWPAGQPYPNVSTLNDSSPTGGAIANAAIVPAGTAGAIQMVAGNITDVIIDINGYYAAPTDPSGNTAIGTGALGDNTTGIYNTATGAGALQSNTTGGFNTASGYGALKSNTTGLTNTADGFGALGNNTTGSDNTANGFDALLHNTTGSSNTASGSGALGLNTTGIQNTAAGASALAVNTTGSENTASGYWALVGNTTGIRNTASGSFALESNTTGGSNTASGYGVLDSNTTGYNDTADGVNALQNNTTGYQNTAIGTEALGLNTTGNNNIAIGYNAALNVSNSNSNNIHIGSLGTVGDGAAANSGVIRIGTAGMQASFFVAGVSGVPTGLGSPVPVLIDANGQLGTMSSSRRFKEDIQDMGDASSGLMRLRPVTFRYKQPYQDGSKPIDYGLIAEEVADVYPDLVAYSPSGEVQTVQYQKVNAMLLNEVQKQHRETSELKARLTELEKQLEALAAPK